MYYILVYKSKKYELNFNMPLFNFKTKQYEGNERKYDTYSEARMTKWKCEKCTKTFQSYKLLFHHKTEIHSYWRQGFTN